MMGCWLQTQSFYDVCESITSLGTLEAVKTKMYFTISTIHVINNLMFKYKLGRNVNNTYSLTFFSTFIFLLDKCSITLCVFYFQSVNPQ